MQTDKDDKRVSQAVIRRLPRYFRHLNDLCDGGVLKISSGALAERMGLTASQVRQDFNCFGGFGQQGYGYNTDVLRNSIAAILHIDKKRTAVIIGAGNLGRALITNFNFSRSGVTLIAAFDNNRELLGTKVAGVTVYDIDRLPQFMAEHSPDIGILTLPKACAKEAAMNLIQDGVRGIWNFTSIDLHLDMPNIPVENVHFSESLMVLSYKLEEGEI